MSAIELTGIAHGGAAVGRLDGRVVFVRGGIPGELVEVRLTDQRKKSFWRGEVVAVQRASSQRVSPPCPVAGVCGGCDFQHVSLEGQRELKRQVVADQLSRLAGIGWQGEVQPIAEDGLGWRTRMRYHRGMAGDLGLRAARSSDVIPLPAQGCLLAHPAGRTMTGEGDEVTVTVADSGVAVNGVPAVVTQRVRDQVFQVAADGFWQVHPRAAEVLVGAVLDGLEVRPGDDALDLYCGAGLFAAFLCAAGANVVGIEGNRAAVGFARRNVADATFHAGDVAAQLERLRPRADVVVLDPPRAGAGRAVVTLIASLRPRRIAYVACDPASLARDLAIFAELGYDTTGISAYDQYPMTHHVECVALLVPAWETLPKPDSVAARPPLTSLQTAEMRSRLRP